MFGLRKKMKKDDKKKLNKRKVVKKEQILSVIKESVEKCEILSPLIIW